MFSLAQLPGGPLDKEVCFCSFLSYLSSKLSTSDFWLKEKAPTQGAESLRWSGAAKGPALQKVSWLMCSFLPLTLECCLKLWPSLSGVEPHMGPEHRRPAQPLSHPLLWFAFVFNVLLHLSCICWRRGIHTTR